MVTNVLVIEPDREFAGRLVQALGHQESLSITLVPSTREACLLLTQQPHDLAFLPITPDDRPLRTLRAAQPDLRIVLTVPDPDRSLPAHFAGNVQGVLVKSLLAADLTTVLSQALSQPVLHDASERMSGAPAATRVSLELGALTAVVEKADLTPPDITAVLSDDQRLQAHWGPMSPAEAAAVAGQVRQSWASDGQLRRAQLQFMNLPAGAGERMLVTYPVAEGYFLTLAAAPDANFGRLRSQTEQLAARLARSLSGQGDSQERLDVVTPSQAEKKIARDHSYAIVWSPLRELPAGLHIPLRRTLRRLAAENGCRLTHVEVRQELVHLVVICPPGRNSSWVAYLFKNGTEEIIQQQYGASTVLWDTGYHAIESEQPLSEAELNIFLEGTGDPPTLIT